MGFFSEEHEEQKNLQDNEDISKKLVKILKFIILGIMKKTSSMKI